MAVFAVASLCLASAGWGAENLGITPERLLEALSEESGKNGGGRVPFPAPGYGRRPDGKDVFFVGLTDRNEVMFTGEIEPGTRRIENLVLFLALPVDIEPEYAEQCGNVMDGVSTLLLQSFALSPEDFRKMSQAREEISEKLSQDKNGFREVTIGHGRKLYASFRSSVSPEILFMSIGIAPTSMLRMH